MNLPEDVATRYAEAAKSRGMSVSAHLRSVLTEVERSDEREQQMKIHARFLDEKTALLEMETETLKTQFARIREQLAQLQSNSE